MKKSCLFALALTLGWGLSLVSTPAWSQALQIAEVKHDGPVDFEKEILPVFRRNCLACHSATEAEGGLVLETPQTILKGGGEGPSVVPGKSAESLLLKLAAHQQKPLMPPPKNDAKAKPLTSQELGLLKLWIDQGAKGEVKGLGGAITWQPLPAGVQPIYAVAITSDGQYAAASRANQIFVYHVPSKRELGRLTDPKLLERGLYKNPGVADVDLVQSLAFSPDGTILASGGFRTVKLWRRPLPAKKLDLAGMESVPRTLAVSVDGKLAAIGEESGKIKIFDLANGQVKTRLDGHTAAVRSVVFSADGTRLVSGSTDKTFKVWNVADGKVLASVETPTPLNAVALVAEEKQIATAGEDNNLRLWEKIEAMPTEAPKPLKEIGGNGQPIVSLAVVGNGAQLVSGSKDQQVKLWDVASGNMVKQLAAGAAVEAVAVRPDGKRVAAVVGNAVKLINVENGQAVVDVKGDFRTGLKVADVTRSVSLAKRNVEATKKDFDEGQKRQKSEEENAKKATEAVGKADEEFKKKDEANKQPTADKEAAEKALAEATTKKTQADDAKKITDEAAVKMTEALTKATQDRDATTKAATESAAAAKTAADKFAAAKAAFDKETGNQGLKDAAAVAEKEAQAADAKSKETANLKAAADKVFADADAAKKAADAAKQAADKLAQDSATAFQQADAKMKQVMPIAQKASDEKAAADRAFQAAKRAVERSADAVKKATEALPGLEKTMKEFEEQAKQRDADLVAAQKTVPESEKPFRAVAFSPNGSQFAVVGEDGLIHTYDGETGAAIDVFGAANVPLAVVAFASNGSVIAAGNNNAGVSWDFATEWKLERTIGSPDTTEAFVDRVTALDFSPDGKRLATGGGEPSRSGEIKIWDVASGALQVAFKEPHSDVVGCVDFSPDGLRIASSGADRFVKMFEAADGKYIRSFEGHTHHVLGVSWRADGRLLASSGADNVIKVWDTRTGDQQRTVQGFTKEVASIRFVGDTDNVIVASGDKLVRMVNAASGGNVRDFGGMTDFCYAAMASADGKAVIAGGADGVVRMWNDQGQPIGAFEQPK